nr:MAG TPA: hypothetical protein [Bacteriophage sp.]
MKERISSFAILSREDLSDFSITIVVFTLLSEILPCGILTPHFFYKYNSLVNNCQVACKLLAIMLYLKKRRFVI